MNPISVPAVWSKCLTIEATEASWGAEAVTAYLAGPPVAYERAPEFLKDGQLVARFPAPHTDSYFSSRRGRALAAISVSLRVHEGHLEAVCSCGSTRGSWGPCAHVLSFILDLAAHPPLLEAIFARGDVGSRVAEAYDARHRLRAEREALAMFARWTGARSVEAIEIAIEVTTEEEYFSENRRPDGPSLYVRVRRVGQRATISPEEIQSIRCAPSDRRLLDLTEMPYANRKAVSARRPLASMLLGELSSRGSVASGLFKGRATFSEEPVRPRITRAMGEVGGSYAARPHARYQPPRTVEALMCEWVTREGHAIPARAALLFEGPSPFVWERATDTFYPVARDVDMSVAARIQATPVLELPPSQRHAVGRALFTGLRGHGIELPPPEVLDLPQIETPTIALRLTGSPLDVCGRLEAIYSSRTVSLPETVATDSTARDLDTEEAALTMVKASGFEVVIDVGDLGLRAEGDRAIDFWQRGILELRAREMPRVEVLLSDKLVHVKVGAPLRARVRIGLMEGWLEANVDFDSDDIAVEMSVIRAALSRGARWITLSDGTLARIHDNVAQLAKDAGELLGKDGRVAPHQLGRLTRWVDEYGGTVDAAVTAFRAKLRTLAVSGEPKMAKRVKAKLRPYQKQGVAWLQFLEELGAGGILADDMGLGKTLMALAFLAHQKETLGPAPSLVVCPTSVAPGWVSEAKRFTPGLRVLLFHGAGRYQGSIAASDLVVTTYALLRSDLEELRKFEFRTVIADEAQNIKNSDTATTLAAKQLRAKMRLALSGTPVENRLRELWSILDFVNPGMLATAGAFESRFERAIIAEPAGAQATELRAIIRPFLLRRTKEEVLLDLPPKTEIEHACTLGPAQKRLYDALALTLRESVSKRIAEVGVARSGLNVLTALLRLRQMACDPRLVEKSTRVPSAKREAFLELVRELVAEGRRALVFSQFVELLTLWRADLDAEKIAYEYLDGSTVDRAGAVDRFQRGRAPLFLISLKAGGSGLNLTAADTVIHCDPWWNPAVEDQATDRAHRIGQERPITVVRLVAKGTVEEKIGALKAVKRELAEAIVGAGAGGTLRGLSEDDVRTLLGDVEGDITEDDAAKPAVRKRRGALSGRSRVH